MNKKTNNVNKKKTRKKQVIQNYTKAEYEKAVKYYKEKIKNEATQQSK